jgi:hypothetical protein
VFGLSIATMFVDCRVGGEIGGRSSASSHIRISLNCEEVLGVLDLGFDLVSLEFATCGGCSSP